MKSRVVRSTEGFTLIEIMIVVLIIGILFVLAIPAFSRARETVQNTRFISDLRVAVHAFEEYNVLNRRYPADRTPGVMPDGMSEYLRGMKWTQPTPIKGSWDWDYQQFGYRAGVSAYFTDPIMPDARMLEIDRKLDDGDLNTGLFRKRTRGYIYIIEF
jgi:prepilin-type N-terminal cleavage/methylation domain-containing protein